MYRGKPINKLSPAIPKKIRTKASTSCLPPKASRKNLFSYAEYKDNAKEESNNKNCKTGILLSTDSIIFKEYTKFLRVELLLFAFFFHSLRSLALRSYSSCHTSRRYEFKAKIPCCTFQKYPSRRYHNRICAS